MRLSKEPRGLTSNRGKASSGRTQWGQLGIQCGEVSSVLVDGRAATFLRAEGDVATCGATCHAANNKMSRAHEHCADGSLSPLPCQRTQMKGRERSADGEDAAKKSNV